MLTAPTKAQDKEPAEQHDSPAEKASHRAKVTHAESMERAWQMLEEGMQSGHPEERISAVSALGTIDRSQRAAEMVEKALKDQDRDVRLAAVGAAASMKSALLIPALRETLDDPAPDVSFTASEALWGMGDHSGQDILIEVLTGERKGAPGFFKSEMHTANKDLHSPKTLAIIGAEQTAYVLMGPFGIGLDAARMMAKSGGEANSARVAAVTLLARDKRASTNRQLITAMEDKDPFVRAAVARGLADFHNTESRNALLFAFGDSKPLVRYMAAAGYIRESEVRPRKRHDHESPDLPHQRLGLEPGRAPVSRQPAAASRGIKSKKKYDQSL